MQDVTTEPTRTRWRWPSSSLFWSLIVVLVLVVVNQNITLPYYVLSPGGARPVNQAIDISPAHEHVPSGKVFYATVSLIEAHPFDLLYSQFDSDDEIKPKREVIGDASPKEFLEANNLSMDESRLVATEVAMRRAGYDVKQQGDGALVRAVTSGSPSEGKLRSADVVVAINGKPVRVASDVTASVRALPVGSNVTLEVRGGDGKSRTVPLTTAPRPGAADISFIGVSVQTQHPKLDTPFPVKVDLGSVGGPSAGLAMTIALLDELTPGELTGGRRVAATGTMDLDATVGPVGGVKQKVAAVKDAKAKLFLVPGNEAEEARRYAGKSLQIVGVDTLDQAIDAIVQSGGQRPSSQAPSDK